MNEKTRQSVDNFKRALSRLEEAINLPDVTSNSLAVDGTIQRFEFCFELFWKALKNALFEDGIDLNTPREVLKQAYQVKWLHDESLWLQMLRDRNRTSHTYEEEIADEIYEKIPQYHLAMRDCLEDIERRI